MNAEPRTITLTTEDYGPVTLPEPAWCRGHDDHQPGAYRSDLTHYSPETVLTFDGAELFRVMVTESPHATRPEDRPICAYLEQAGFTGPFTPAGLYDFAAALDAHADRLRDFADDLAVILAGGAR